MMVLISKKELDLLSELRRANVKAVARRLGKSEAAIYMAVSRIRKKRRELFRLLNLLKPYQNILAVKKKHIEEGDYDEEYEIK